MQRPDFATYKFYISNPQNGERELVYPPGNWKDEFVLERHKLFKGVFRRYAKQTIYFYKDGLKYLKKLKKEIGVNAKIYFRVEKIQNDWTYKEIFNGKIITLSLKEDDIKMEAQIEDIDGLVLLNKRKSQTVNLGRKKTLSGLDLPDNVNTLTLPEQNFYFTAGFDVSTHQQNPISGAAHVHYVVPIILTGSQYDEAQTPRNIGYSTGKERAFFYSSTIPQSIKVKGKINYKHINNHVYMELYVIDSTGSKTYSKKSGNLHAIGFWYLDETLNLEEGDSVYLDYYVDGAPQVSLSFSGYLNLSGVGRVYPDLTFPAWTLHDAFKQCIKIISDLDFESQFLTENHLMIFPGYNIRGGRKNPATNLKNLIQTAFVLKNLGMGFENGKIIVEHMSYFYENADTFDLSDRVLKGDIEKEYSTDYFNQLEIGFEKYVLEHVNGLTEFNTVNKYSTLSEIEKKLTIKSKFRGDTIGIVKLRENALLTDPSKDVNGDDDIFIVSAVNNNGNTYFTAKTNEGYEVYPDGWYNLDFAPSRIARLHNINAYVTTDLVLEHKPKDVEMISKEVGKPLINETEDIPIAQIVPPLFKPEIITVNTHMTKTEIDNLNKKQRIIIINDELKGYILKITYNYKKNDVVTLKLIESW